MRSLYIVVLAGLTAGALAFAWLGLQPSAEDAAARSQEEMPRYALTGATWVRLNRAGVPEFRAHAEFIDYYADESARLRSLTVDALGGATSPWHLEASEGRVPPHERRILLTGEVEAHGQHSAGAPVVFTTGELWVDLLRRELHTEAPVQVTSEFRRASARGLKADFNGERVQLLHDVKVDYAPRS